MKFLRTFLAALLAVVVGFGLIAMLWAVIMAGIISSMGSKTAATIQSGSILRLDLGRVTEAPSRSIVDGFDLLSLSPSVNTPLLSAIRAIQAAATDERIEGIYIRLDEKSSASLSALEEIRAELSKFRESGKPVVAYQDYYDQVRYWFASVADRVYVNPAGSVGWHGISAQMMFFKGLLDKLGIEPVVVRHGSFKSAVEPFVADRMSPENRLQYQRLTGSLWNVMTEDVAQSRDIPAAELQRYADRLSIDSPAAAMEMGLVDSLLYEDQVLEVELGGKKLVSLADYSSQVVQANPTSRNKIAVIYASGEIVSGEGAKGETGSEWMAKKIAAVRGDDNVKALVLRIDSPGGSALASEVIWRELELLKAQKPVIVSMGSQAASGGYYIAAPADVILADRTTVTGSIGVFGLFANVAAALEEKLGITTDVVRTAAHSDVGSMLRAPSAAEMAYFQKSVEQVYSTFVDHVAQGRNMSFEQVDDIGQGRVWSGLDALEVGLVDGFGGLIDAIALAADRVGIMDDFRISEVVDTPTGLDALLGTLSMSIRGVTQPDELAAALTYYERVRRMLGEGGVQARMPFVAEIE